MGSTRRYKTGISVVISQHSLLFSQTEARLLMSHTLLNIVNPFTVNPFKALHYPYWSNPPFLIFDIRELWRPGLSARAPECQKLKIVG